MAKTVKTGTTTNYIQHYAAGIEYNSASGINRRVEAIYHGEGRFFNTNTGTTTPIYRTEFSIKDHLGNARVTFTDLNANGKIDVTNNATTNEIIQENHYYAFGMAHEGPWLMNHSSKDNNYLYNYKEHNADHDLKWYDYGARFYDAVIGRWHVVDRYSEKYFNLNPYHFGSNNPILFVDINGDSIKLNGEQSQKLIDILNEGVGRKVFTIGEDGKMHFTKINDKDLASMSDQSKNLYSEVSSIVGQSEMININVVSNSETVTVAHFASNTIDISDVSAFGTDAGINKFTVLAHELAEQNSLQTTFDNIATKEAYKQSHDIGKSIEQKVGGHQRHGDRATSDYKTAPDEKTIIQGGIITSYQLKSGKRMEMKATFNNSNITKVQRRNAKN